MAKTALHDAAASGDVEAVEWLEAICSGCGDYMCYYSGTGSQQHNMSAREPNRDIHALE